MKPTGELHIIFNYVKAGAAVPETAQFLIVLAGIVTIRHVSIRRLIGRALRSGSRRWWNGRYNRNPKRLFSSGIKRQQSEYPGAFIKKAAGFSPIIKRREKI
jgi:hypothetical protein